MGNSFSHATRVPTSACILSKSKPNLLMASVIIEKIPVTPVAKPLTTSPSHLPIAPKGPVEAAVAEFEESSSSINARIPKERAVLFMLQEVNSTWDKKWQGLQSLYLFNPSTKA